MTENTKMREAFEKWLNKGNHCGCNENMWKAWQAAHAAALAEAAKVPVKRVAVTSDVVARLGGQRLCCDCGTVLAMDDGTMCGECFSNRFGESYSSKPSVAQVPVMGEAIWKKQKQAELDAKDARISELEFVIEEIIRINHYDFRGHEIARAAMQERQP